jgi:hypothetical protein
MYGVQTPIDIHCGKLVDWLVQRRHCKKDWGENLASIRRKIKSALKDMPESEEIKDLLIGSKLDYFKSKKIVDILKKTEADSKNIFGYYSSQRMKDWQDVVSSYERDCIFLAELATDLIRETNYEVPGIRKLIQKLGKEKDDAEREKANLLRRNQQFSAEYQRLAQSYGIKGQNVIEELQEQFKNLSTVMNDMANLAKKLKSGLEFYREYAACRSKQQSEEFLATLYHIITKGNVTVYELRYGEAPEKIILEEKAASSVTNSNPSEIELVNDEIDFGDDLPSSSESSSGFVHVSTNDDTFVQVEGVCDEANEKVAKGDEAKLILEFRKSRNQFLNNLHELDAFFKQLIGDDQADSSQFSKSDMNKQTSIIHQIIDLVKKEKNRVLFQISDSPNFIENIGDRFSAKMRQASECSTKAELVDVKIEDIQAQIRDAEVQLKRSIVSAKEQRDKVECSISEMYKGRPINIMGCVN